MDKPIDLKNKRLFIVLGMHRCGTSAITRGLQVMGVDLGDRLMQVDEGNNDKGFWEDVDINALNVEMLSAVDNDWHHLSPIENGDLALLKEKGFIKRAEELLRKKTQHTDLFGFKDPRISKLLPFWKEVFEKDNYIPHYILAVRHPLSVALSLAKRNGIDIEKSHSLWLTHTICALSEVAGSNYVVVDYDRLMQDAYHELRRIAEKFHLTINQAHFKKYKSEFLDDGLRHTRFNYENLMDHERSFDFLKDVYTGVMELAAGAPPDENELRRKTGIWEGELDKLKFTFKMADGAFYQLNRVYLQSLENEELFLKEKEAKANETQKLNESLVKSLKQAEQIEQLQTQLTEKEEIIALKNRNIAEKTDIIADQENIITQKEQFIADQKQIILQEREEKNRLLNSRSWRYTKPLRYIAKLLRKLFSSRP